MHKIIDIKRDREDLQLPLTNDKLQRMTENEVKIRDYKVANHKLWLLEEASAVANQR